MRDAAKTALAGDVHERDRGSRDLPPAKESHGRALLPMTGGPLDDVALPAPLVHEVAGPAFTPLQTVAGLSVGVISLLMSGLLALLLGALAEEHRISIAASPARPKACCCGSASGERLILPPASAPGPANLCIRSS